MPDQPKGVLPHIIVENCAAAVDFYIKALGAKELMRVPDKDGKRIMHAELEINDGVIYLNDDYPEYWGKSRTPKAFGGSPVIMHLNVANCDESVKRAVDAGAKCIMGPSDMFWGARYAQVVDPFGQTWALMHPLAQNQ
jgi:PhnB protein